MRYLFVFLSSFLGTYILTSFMRKIAKRLKLLDYPDPRKIHTQPVPLLGGLAIAIPSLLLIFFLNNLSPSTKGLVIGGIIILITGLIDDLRKLPVGLRLCIQVLVSLIIIRYGIVLTFLPDTAWGKLGEWVLTIIWIMGITNALNFLDGMDGLATGITAVCSLSFFILAIQTRQNQLALMSIVILGGCLGFLPYNFHPARIFLGDAGSTFLGFTLASIAIIGNWAEDNVVGLSIPILVLGVPIFDMSFTTIMRVRNRKVKTIVQWIEYVAKDHFHHRLVDLGLRPKGAVLFIYFVCACLGISAVVLYKASRIDALLLLTQAAIIFTIIAVLMVIGKRRRSGWNLK